MLVKGWLSSQVISVDEETSMMKAYVLMKENNIRRLPVVQKGKLVGIVTDTDLKEACPSTATTLDIYEINYLLSEIKVKESMSKDVIYVKPDETVEFAAILMLENKISGLPVVNDQGNLIGVITQTDIFKALIHISGAYIGHIQLALCLEDRPGSIKEVADVIRSFGGRMVSILTSYGLADEGYRNVYIRIKPLEREKLSQMVDILEDRFTVLYTAKESLEEEKDRRFLKKSRL
ncbi:MAG: CBS and ACT domain-containing protein [Proteobacteria bacterium]|nr:CBS domain-containing protein [Desulfobacteraceae bacterium]MBU2521528.1 CBS and ACT domain-containing protein [Pseudomonadota bacterium]MBU3981236.1 CBS and ACT domain-containing protein [Pseudomonadota bacterium]MBU4011928.1 CBS and ACT domain-containing protein [Pseudomonadota bacterium]MBU4067856.1 CBS and ACT domain-containing protein [Pseudomonadota bacterium]